MRLTVELILNARAHINPLRERELDLRGYKIPVLENLGATKDGFDCLDFSDNEIKKLENFPRLRRLRMLLFHNNKIARIQDNLVDAIPNLSVLLLTNNNIANLTDIDPLRCLEHLDILFNFFFKIVDFCFFVPLTFFYIHCRWLAILLPAKQYVIHTLPQLRVLDYKKIRPVEREEAVRLFNSLAGKKIAVGEQATEVASTEATKSPPRPSVTQLQAAIVNAKSLAEVERLEEQVKQALSPPPAPQSPVKSEATESSTSTKRSPLKAEVKHEVAETTPKTSKRAKVATPISSMKVAELKEELKQRGLSIKGVKADLVARLEESMQHDMEE
ncbi:U2 small nuclear ribonucleoprotein A' [Thraustotheca clavata]|uniref:U2 small nuclear ribonucleoprotein A n=1 Tax=Thraustotheca clavata TaxID=74557 RepID=A0A1V9ZP78_9STRA|nr:U2 small nuclear ribonucleoprotein A' [Thraustotheca clavata]